jgi:hypothetical protein
MAPGRGQLHGQVGHLGAAQDTDRAFVTAGGLTSYAANDPEGQVRIAAFRQGLSELGWSDGGNVPPPAATAPRIGVHPTRAGSRHNHQQSRQSHRLSDVATRRGCGGAPKTTPVGIVDKLNKEINAALADPKIKARLADLGGTALAGSPTDFGRLIADETEKWGKVIRAANIKPD